MSSEFVRCVRAIVVLCAVVVLAVARAPQESKPAQKNAGYAWTLAEPKAGSPCPSFFAKLETPVELRLGEYELDDKKPPVVDGDTLRLKALDGSVRFIGIDAEETFKEAGKQKLAETDWSEYLKTIMAGHNPQRPPKYGTPMGMAAKDALEQMLKARPKVRIEFDEPTRKKDSFDRYLGLLFIPNGAGQTCLNIELVRQGLSPYFVKYGRSRRFDKEFAAAEAEAQSAKRGIWGPQEPIRHYDDYEIRSRWWNERDQALTAALKLAATRKDIYFLGRDDEWARLKAAVGKRATVVTTVEGFKEAGNRGLVSFAHGKKLDFMVVGEPGTLKELNWPKAFEGDLIYVTGVVALYKENPQFIHDAKSPVVISKSPPAASIGE